MGDMNECDILSKLFCLDVAHGLLNGRYWDVLWWWEQTISKPMFILSFMSKQELVSILWKIHLSDVGMPSVKSPV